MRGSEPMDRYLRVVRILFGTGIVSIGALVLAYGSSVLLFLPAPPAWDRWLTVVACLSAFLLVGTGVGILFERLTPVSLRVLLPFLFAWLLTRVPVVVADPLREISWFAVGEVAVPFAAALILFLAYAGAVGGSRMRSFAARHARWLTRILVGGSLVTFGLSHFFEFAERTVSLVPAWMPYRVVWADLAGAAQVAAGLGVLFPIYPRWAAAAQAAMLSLFTLLVWVPAVITDPQLPSNWIEFLFTWALAASCWVVAVALPMDPQRSSPELGKPRDAGAAVR